MTRTAPACRNARRGGCCTEQVWAASGAETAETESAAVVQVVSPSDEGAAQDEYGVAAAIISKDDTPLSIPDEETPPSGNAETGFWSILFQLLKHLAGKH